MEYSTNGIIDVNREHAGSAFLAYFNVVCVVAGTGTLGLPYALRLGGWIGILILFLAWFMSMVCFYSFYIESNFNLPLFFYSTQVFFLFDVYMLMENNVCSLTKKLLHHVLALSVAGSLFSLVPGLHWVLLFYTWSLQAAT